MKPSPASVDITKSVATMRSPRLAELRSAGSAGSSRGRGCGGPPGLPGGGVASMDLASAGGGVPMTRCLGCSPSAAPFWPVESVMSLPALHCDPERRKHHEEQQAEAGHQPLGHGTYPAQAEAAWIGLVPGLYDIGDDVALLLRRDGGVVKDRHRLRAGEHGLVDLPRR